MHGRTYKKYYFKINIFVQNKTYLYKVKKKPAKIKQKTKKFFFKKNFIQKWLAKLMI
jgi:predicted RNA-binding protein